MSAWAVVDKTEKGAHEVKARALKLAPRLRTMLILVDGEHTVSQLQDSAAQLGAPSDFLDTLMQQGLVSLRPGTPPRRESTGPSTLSGSSTSTITSEAVAPDAAPRTDADRFQAAQKLMNDSIVDAMGFRAFFFTLKLERCFNRADLLALIDEYTRAIGKHGGPQASRLLEQRVRSLLG